MLKNINNLKDLFVKYKAVIRFIVLFFGTYLILSAAYSFYLKASVDSAYFPDFITNLVAKQSAAVLETFGYTTDQFDYHKGGGVILTIEKAYSVNVVEGCNAVSVIILFISFIIAFAKDFKKTFLFLLAGIALIYVVNIIRISLLTIALYKFPEYQELLHGVLFPAVIYGMVLILWIVWVRNINTPASDE